MRQYGASARSKSFPLRLILAFPIIAAVAATSPANTPEEAFLQSNATAMDAMMRGMTVRPSGNIDADFVNMMEPHHEGAVDMARLELRYGSNEQLRRIAQEIIVDQRQEIIAMRLALGRPLPEMAPTPDQEPPAPGQNPMLMPVRAH